MGKVSLRSGVLDLDRREIHRGGEVSVLSTIETDLLRWFLDRPGEVATRDTLLVEVWGFPRPVMTRAVDNTIMRLRRKLEVDPKEPDHLKTLRGVGYVFEGLRDGAERGESTPSHMPATSPMTSFFGRQAELAAVTAALSDARLATVLGAGGVGKTRLVHEWSAGRSDVTFCALAACSSDVDLRQAVAAAIGAPEAAPEALRAAIAGHVGVLVLDNVEQLTDVAAPRISEWLSAAPALRILATSRERLRLGGERVVHVEPLDTPSAVALFQDRAALLRGDVGDAEVVAAIVQALDRLPLAVELAASRVLVLPPQRLLEALGDHRRVLRSEQRDLPERHRTMDRTIEWSWALLTEAERHALCTVSVLVDGFDLDTFEATVDPGEGGPWALDVLAALRDRSLVVASEGFQGDARFRLLEVVRQFAAKRLAELDDRTGIEDRVLLWFRVRSGRWRQGVHGKDPTRSIQALTRERANLVALARRCWTRCPEDAAQIVFNLGWHILNRSPDPEVLELGVRAADRAGHARLRVANRLLHGRMLEWTGRGPEAEVLHQTALDLARKAEPGQVAIASFHVASHLGRRGAYDEAIATCHAGLAAAAAHEQPALDAMLQNRLGSVLREAGRLTESRAALLLALQGYEALGHAAAVPYPQLGLSFNAAAHGRLDEAEERALDCIRRCEALSLSRFRLSAVQDLGFLRVLQERPDEVEALLVEIDPELTALGDPALEASSTLIRAAAALQRGLDVDLAALSDAQRLLRDQQHTLWMWVADGLALLATGAGEPPTEDHAEARAWRTWLGRIVDARAGLVPADQRQAWLAEPVDPPSYLAQLGRALFRGPLPCYPEPSKTGVGMRVSLMAMVLLAGGLAASCNPPGSTPDDPDTSTPGEVLPDPPSTAWADDVPAAMTEAVTVIDGGAIIGFDRDKKDALTVYGDCAARLHACLEETQGDFATCVDRAPVCQTDTPWEEGVCCPRQCGTDFSAALAAGDDPADAYLKTFARDLSCFPGVAP